MPKHAMKGKSGHMMKAKEMDAMVKTMPAHAMPKGGAKKAKGGKKRAGR